MSEPSAPEERKIFISYSHSDRPFVERLATALHEEGEDVWWAPWEINVGDSLVAKIFEEGLARAKAFVVVLSPESVRSKWVREELDHATVRRIEGLTRVIPIIKEDTEIPPSLRTLRWLDMRRDFEAGVAELVRAVHGASAKPPPSTKLSLGVRLPSSFGGLSPGASAVGIAMIEAVDEDSGLQVAFSGEELGEMTGLDPQGINDAVDELAEVGAVRRVRTMGTAPFEFLQVEPTYVLFSEAAEHLAYDPGEDVRVVAAAVASLERATGEELRDATQLSPGRLNRAMAFLEDYSLARVLKWMGTSPFSFGQVDATRRTRQFVERSE